MLRDAPLPAAPTAAPDGRWQVRRRVPTKYHRRSASAIACCPQRASGHVVARDRKRSSSKSPRSPSGCGQVWVGGMGIGYFLRGLLSTRSVGKAHSCRQVHIGDRLREGGGGEPRSRWLMAYGQIRNRRAVNGVAGCSQKTSLAPFSFSWTEPSPCPSNECWLYSELQPERL